MRLSRGVKGVQVGLGEQQLGIRLEIKRHRQFGPVKRFQFHCDRLGSRVQKAGAQEHAPAGQSSRG